MGAPVAGHGARRCGASHLYRLELARRCVSFGAIRTPEEFAPSRARLRSEQLAALRHLGEELPQSILQHWRGSSGIKALFRGVSAGYVCETTGIRRTGGGITAPSDKYIN